MKYFLDTEFNEDFDKPFLGRNRHFIDLISIGIVSEDNQEYYAVSKDFDLKAAWNKFQMKPTDKLDLPGINRAYEKEYWLRDNVLFPIWKELEYMHYRTMNNDIAKEYFEVLDSMPEYKRIDFYHTQMQRYNYDKPVFSFANLKRLIKTYGKSIKQIKYGIVKFICPVSVASDYAGVGFLWEGLENFLHAHPIEFYGYFADYDWVIFCSIFGRMLDLPKGFPMYCRDLKQMLVDMPFENKPEYGCNISKVNPSWKDHYLYPKQENEHNALSDAKWNLELFKFIKSIND